MYKGLDNVDTYNVVHVCRTEELVTETRTFLTEEIICNTSNNVRRGQASKKTLLIETNLKRNVDSEKLKSTNVDCKDA